MSNEIKYYEFPKCDEKFVGPDGVCELLIQDDTDDVKFIKSGLEDVHSLDEKRSLAKLELCMDCLLLKKKNDQIKALKAIEDEFLPLIEELQYFIDKQKAVIHLNKRYHVVLKDKK